MKNIDTCTGCSACINICPRSAIFMKENEYGFVYPNIDDSKCVHCGLCEQVCEKAKKFRKNQYKEAFALQGKDYDLIKKSSSGGMFAQLAKYALSQNGIVFGCSMEKVGEMFEIKHIAIENVAELHKLQGSKYVQSDVGYSYRQVKDFLNQKRLVLFSGTPCQVAGLKAYLNKDYSNLLCVDLSCTGVPSSKLFNDYIQSLENKYSSQIIKFDFRNKEKLGWSCGSAFANFSNNKTKVLDNFSQSFLSLFINGNIQRQSCYSCNYTGLNRVSDITIADCWGIEEEYPEFLSNLDKNKGISLVLLNTVQGQNFFNLIKENLKVESINPRIMNKHNHPLLHPTILRNAEYIETYKNEGYIGLEQLFNKNLGLKKYYFIVKKYTPNIIKNFIKQYTRYKKVDCLLMTMYGNPNYGSLLTAYALQKTIEKLGYKNQIIDYANFYGYNTPFIKKYLKLTSCKCVSSQDFIRLNQLCETFILGSDNLINFSTSDANWIYRNLLNFTKLSKKRLMISGSMGSWNGETNTKEQYNYLKYLLNRFDYISTREKFGQNVLKEKFYIKADWINDPVFYLKSNEYYTILKNATKKYSNTIMEYILYPTTEKQKIVQYFANKYKLGVEQFQGNENVKSSQISEDFSVENWLSAIKNSELIITDSFHCICFALIFNKPFVCLKNNNSTCRFTSLFERLDIEYKFIENTNDAENIKLELDWSCINQKIEEIQNFALDKLNINIKKTKLITNTQKEDEIIFKKYNLQYLQKSVKWFRKNKLLYLYIIEPIVLPIMRLIHDIK